jgi:P4 family phage/plasmid primase-like protien
MAGAVQTPIIDDTQIDLLLSLGFPVFPAHSAIENGNGGLRCTCGRLDCGSPAKHPFTPNGLLDAVHDVASYRRLCLGHNDLNVALATGDIVVIDIDPHHGGAETWERLVEEIRITDAVENTVWQISGAGGRHIFFRGPAGLDLRNSAGALGSGLDVRARGGYIIGPGSRHISGGVYSFEASHHPDDVAIAPLPPALLARILASARNRNRNHNGTFRQPEQIKDGARNDTLYRFARSMRAKGAGGVAIRAAVHAENREKCVPPLSDAEIDALIDGALKQPDRPDFAEQQTAEDRTDAPRGKKRKNEWTAAACAAAILAHDRFAQDRGGYLCHFCDGVYQTDGNERIKRLVKALVPGEDWTSRLGNETVEYIRLDAPRLWSAPPVDVLNVRNGLLDVNTLTLRPHSSDYLSSIQLPVSYNAQAKCPEWDKQIAATLPPDVGEAGVIYMLIAWLMLPLTFIQKAILLLGVGGTGRSTLLAAICAFLGRANVSAMSLQMLETHRFATVELFGKLANICADLPSTALETSSVFKQLTGFDEIAVERKYHASHKIAPFARMLFSANEYPRSKDATGAFFQRWLVLRFDRTYRGQAGELKRNETRDWPRRRSSPAC